MKILFVNNYTSWKTVYHGDKPSHHLFGVKERVEEWFISGNRYTAVLKDGMGTVDFRLCNSLGDAIKIFFQSWRYDVVYDTANELKKISLLIYFLSPAKLVQIVHHPPFEKQFSFRAKADAYIFFSVEHMAMAEKLAPNRKRKMFLNEWAPDLKWYEKYASVPDSDKEYDIVDNGRTARDHKIVVKALRESGAFGFVFDNELHGEKRVYDSPHTYVSEDEAMSILAKSKFLAVLLTPLDRPYGPIGATVLMDAIGMGLPVVVSSNFYLSEEVHKNNLGIVVPAGNNSALIKALSDIHCGRYDLSLFRESIRVYSRSHNVDIYSDRLFSILKSL